jgi:hypothetical protein
LQGKKIEHSYSKFQKKSNGVFSGFLSYGSEDIFFLIDEGRTFGGPINVGFREEKNRKKKLIDSIGRLVFNLKSPIGFFII